MAHDHVEIEAKYSAPEGSQLPWLEGLDGVARVDPLQAQRLVATYFDTRDVRLARLGITLRWRTGGDDAGWHLKVPVETGRYEAQEPATTDQAMPAPIAAALVGVTRGRELTPMLGITTRRTIQRLRDARGSVLAEVADDRVHAHGTGSGAGPGVGCGVAETDWREWEVELVDGGPELVEQVVERFRRAGGAPASHDSKLARALGEVVALPGEPANPEGTHDAEDVVLGRLREQVTQLLRCDVLVRRDVEDSVHQMRVATRRLRGALTTNQSMFQRERTEPLRAELKWLTSVLGQARDAEVLRDNIGQLAAEEGLHLVDQPVIDSVQEELVRRYRDSHEQVLHQLGSVRYAGLVDSLELLLADTPWSPSARRQQPTALRKRVRHDWKRLEGAVSRAEKTHDTQARRQRLHDARKAAKRARYAAEPLVPIYGGPAQRLVKATTRVQSTLGDLHDATVTMDELDQLASKEPTGTHDAVTLGVLRSRQQTHAAEIEARFKTDWRKARRKKLRRWLD